MFFVRLHKYVCALKNTQFKSMGWYAYVLILVVCLDDAEGIHLPNLDTIRAKSIELLTQTRDNCAAAKSLIPKKASEMHQHLAAA
jgi:hypothetical protein